ncbi:cytochrome b [Bacterioplanoides sp. SCSIO 12839]|uniref:cytochrome b n=1 Tax=Bacterioplanoides sp. SCSIO 12839 TaxID=2829569 RepID=UPI0021069FAD|nr:cytochrome b [Bacterioplanoides sp. SCSIO 12839]UTW49082.1 cytochrome b [Bacterioplanoides sp. SCSIO 12839]
MSYNLPTKLIHWSSAAVILTLLVVGIVMEDMENSPQKWEIYDLHKSFGVIALLLILLRIPVRISNPVAPLSGTPRGDVIKAKAVQGLMYVCMLVMPISGLIMSQAGGHEVALFGLELPMVFAENHDLHEVGEALHGLTAWALMFLLLAHIGAALLHHFKMKDDTLKRMLFKN